jgi:hypothetical protein
MDSGYTTPEGVHITRELRQEFLNVRQRYRDQDKLQYEMIPLRDLPEVPNLSVSRLPPRSPQSPRVPVPRTEPILIPRRERRSDRATQEDRAARAARASKGKGSWFGI